MVKTGQNIVNVVGERPLFKNDTHTYTILGSFYYVTLSLMDGMLNLNVFPEHTLGSVKQGEKATLYNDSKWHSVSLLIQQSMISLQVDDYTHFK